ncbi:MAG: hypothetical protein ACI39H_01540 [Lachnospiraceae bacterium]
MKMTSVTKRLMAILLTLTMIVSGIIVMPDTAKAATTYGEITEGVAASSKTINVLTKKKFYMHPNESINVSVGSKYSKSTVKWSTSTSSIMSYDSKSGYKTKITLKKAGTAKGTVKIGSKSYSFTVVVTNIKVLKTSLTFSKADSKYYKTREVLYCSSWGTNEYISSVKCVTVGLKSSLRKVSANTYSKTHSVYLYPMEFGSGDAKITITTQNGCKHVYLIKTEFPYTKAMETAYKTLKAWQEEKAKSLPSTDAEILEKINEFSQIPGYREGEDSLHLICGDFADAIVRYVWYPDYAYVKLSNPTKILISKHISFAYKDTPYTMSEEAEQYMSLDELYESGNLGSGFNETVCVSVKKPYVRYSMEDVQIGDLVYCDGHVGMVMELKRDESSGKIYFRLADSNSVYNKAPSYATGNWMYWGGVKVVSYREQRSAFVQ